MIIMRDIIWTLGGEEASMEPIVAYRLFIGFFMICAFIWGLGSPLNKLMGGHNYDGSRRGDYDPKREEYIPYIPLTKEQKTTLRFQLGGMVLFEGFCFWLLNLGDQTF